VHPRARVDPSATILPLAYVGADTVVGPRTLLYPGAVVLERCRLGADCLVYPGAVVREDCVLGDRVILHNSASIGADGYGFAQQSGSTGRGAAGVIHVKIPQVGNVVLEDDVEIGAGTCVDRAALGSTRIGRGTKIDDLVMVGHGCQIGAHSLIVAQSGLAGSAVLGERSVLGARAGVLGHLTVGAGATLMSRSHVTKSVPPGSVVSGNPARPHREQLRHDAALAGYARERATLLARLGSLVERVEKLEKTAAPKPDRKAAPAKRKLPKRRRGR
jgi:UDP-3-O-[3-hydroxymyristoyl] glucosamine N-acyltransferase